MIGVLIRINSILCRVLTLYFIIGLIIAVVVSIIWFINGLLNYDSYQDTIDEIIEDYSEVDLQFKSTFSLWGFILMTIILFWPFCIYVAIRK